MSVTERGRSVFATNPAHEEELGRLPALPIAQLRLRYRELFRTDPPKAFGPDLLRRSIAQRTQENAYGALSRSVQRLLDQLVKAYIAQPGGRIVLSRRIKPGSVLLREWNGQSHRVMVLADGFAYDGKTFRNLSEIAGLITGTRWNGPRFFGLRSKAQDLSEPSGVPDPSAGGKLDAVLPRSGHLGGGSDYRKRNAARASQSLRGSRYGL